MLPVSSSDNLRPGFDGDRVVHDDATEDAERGSGQGPGMARLGCEGCPSTVKGISNRFAEIIFGTHP